MNKRYKITFRFKTGSNGQQHAHVYAPNPGVAKQLFEQSNPGCIFSSCILDE